MKLISIVLLAVAAAHPLAGTGESAALSPPERRASAESLVLRDSADEIQPRAIYEADIIALQQKVHYYQEKYIRLLSIGEEGHAKVVREKLQYYEAKLNRFHDMYYQKQEENNGATWNSVFGRDNAKPLTEAA